MDCVCAGDGGGDEVPMRRHDRDSSAGDGCGANIARLASIQVRWQPGRTQGQPFRPQ